ncbi:thioredoxin family protein [Pontiellaceae bacterium B12227]|nr:thioredoxin family protein [Pontiellaceae bacterium B12227]
MKIFRLKIIKSTMAALATMGSFAWGGQLTEDSIRELFRQKDRLLEQERVGELIKLYTPDATVRFSFAVVSPGSSREMAIEEYAGGLNNAETELIAHTTTPVSISISDNKQSALVQSTVRQVLSPRRLRKRQAVWHIDESFPVVYTNGAPRIASGQATIVRMTLEPDEFYTRVMALIKEQGALERGRAIELLEESKCRFREGDGKRKKTSIDTGYIPFCCGDEIPALASQIPDLQALNLGFSSGLTDEGMKFIGQMKQLESLRLTGTEITDQGIAELAGCTNLSSLSIQGTAFTGNALQPIAALPRLQTLEISGGTETIKGLALLATAPALENLALNIGLSDNHLKQLADFPSLKALRITGGTITDAGLHHFQALEKLTRVYFSDTGVTYAGTQQLKKQCPHLRVDPDSLTDPCKHTLSSIEYAKAKWADRNKKENGVLPTKEDLKSFLKYRGGWAAMTCQDGGIISMNPVGTPADCSIHGKAETRKRALPLDGLSKDDFDTDGAKVGRWTMDLDAAEKLADEKQLPILLNFTGSDWCYWCKLMEKNVFIQPEWKVYAADSVVMVLVDFPRDKTAVPEKYKERNNRLKDQYEISGYPTFILLRPDGKTECARLRAGRNKTPESFIGEIKAALTKETD